MKSSHTRRLFVLLLVSAATAASASARRRRQGPKRIYTAPDDHTDYMWAADEETYRQAFLRMTDFYLDPADATAANPAPYQSRRNCDGSYWMWTYERNRSAAQFERFINRVRSGHASVPLNTLVSTYGGALPSVSCGYGDEWDLYCASMAETSASVKRSVERLRAVAEDATLARAEANRAFVLMEYFGYLRRNPNEGQDTNFDGYFFRLGKLGEFGGNYVAAEMAKAFLSSIEYRQRFAP